MKVSCEQSAISILKENTCKLLRLYLKKWDQIDDAMFRTSLNLQFRMTFPSFAKILVEQSLSTSECNASTDLIRSTVTWMLQRQTDVVSLYDTVPTIAVMEKEEDNWLEVKVHLVYFGLNRLNRQAVSI